MGTLRIAFLSALVLELAATMSTAVIAVEIGIRLVDGGIALAPALAILVLAPEYYGPLRNAAAQFHASADGLAAAARVFSLLDLPPAVRTPEDPLPAPDLREAAIRLERVTLRYPGRDAPAVLGISAVVEPGERVAVAGPSGAGKTSLLALLLRLLEPSAGRIVAGGIDLARVDPDAWRTGVAWLPQRPRLATGTVRTALGDRADAELWHALELRRGGLRRRGAPRRARYRSRRAHAALGGRDPPARARARARDRQAAPAARRADDAPGRDERRARDARDRGRSRATRRSSFATHDPRLVEIADRVIDLGVRGVLEAVA